MPGSFERRAFNPAQKSSWPLTLTQKVKDSIEYREVSPGMYETILPGRILSAIIEGLDVLEYIASGKAQRAHTTTEMAAVAGVMKIELAILQQAKRMSQGG